jgi:hypothetical protein
MRQVNPDLLLQTTPVFLNGRTGVIARHNLVWKLPISLGFDAAHKKVTDRNAEIAETYPGVGYYVSDPMEEITDPNYCHYVLFCDDEFFKALAEIYETN